MEPLPSFADRDGLIWLDGKLVPWREARVHVLTHGLHYGSAVFEGLRSYDGKILALSAHSERLLASARMLDMELSWTREQIDQACIEVMRANGLTDCYIRPVAWRGSDMMAVGAPGARSHLAIACWEWNIKRDGGLRLAIGKWRRPPPHTAPVHAKAAGLYMIGTLSKHAAEAAGYYDALMLDWRGQVTETTGANVFFVRNGELHTPTPDCFLDGITRRIVIDLARRRGIKVIERAIWPEELESFEQMFVTGTAAEVAFVSEVGPWRFEIGELSKQLKQDYSHYARGRLR